MSESVCGSETASCTAITEKRQDNNNGGCTGILFRLFDWNRKLAKKKLFSRKLLPPAHQANRAAKKFKGDEKMPINAKHRFLIGDENKGGFSRLKKNVKGTTDIVLKQEMQAPCLIARLMGLDLIPAVQRDNTKKPSPVASPNYNHIHEDTVVGSGGNGADREGWHLEKRQQKHEIGPQKLRKAWPSKTQAPTRFAPAAMQIRGVLSTNKKHHHPAKLAAIVKSPRASSARNVNRVSRSRLVDAATRILEPGLAAKNKYRYAISYPEDTAPSAEPFVGNAACRNCGSILEDANFTPIIAARTSDCVASTSDVTHAPHEDQEKKVACMTSQQNMTSISTRLKNVLMEHKMVLRDELPVPSKFQELHGWTESGQKDESSSISLKHGTMKQNHPLFREERMPACAQVGNFRKRRIGPPIDSSERSLISFNCRPTGQTHAIVSAVHETSNADACAARISTIRRANSSSQMRAPVKKRRFINVDQLDEKPNSVSYTSRGQNNPKSRPLTGKEKLLDHYYNDGLMIIRRRSCNRAKGAAARPSNVNCPISLALNSSLKSMAGFYQSSNAAGSFSNCGCIRSNFCDGSGTEVHTDFGNKIYDHPRPFRFGNSNEQEGLHKDVAIGLYARTSKNFCCHGIARASRYIYELSHAQKVAVDAELVFGDAKSFSKCCFKEFRVIPFLLNKLEKSASSSLSDIIGFMGSDTTNSNHLRDFLLDCLFECLESRFFCHIEFSPWKKLPLSMDLDTLMREVEVEVRSWEGLCSTSIDEIIEWDMGHSFEKWTVFRDEALEYGIAIDSHIFQILMEEIIEDLHGACGPKCSY